MMNVNRTGNMLPGNWIYEIDAITNMETDSPIVVEIIQEIFLYKNTLKKCRILKFSLQIDLLKMKLNKTRSREHEMVFLHSKFVSGWCLKINEINSMFKRRNGQAIIFSVFGVCLCVSCVCTLVLRSKIDSRKMNAECTC